MKTCTKCERELPDDMYYKNKTSKNEKQTQCKDCIKDSCRKRYVINRTKHIEEVGTWESLDESVSKWQSDIG